LEGGTAPALRIVGDRLNYARPRRFSSAIEHGEHARAGPLARNSFWSAFTDFSRRLPDQNLVAIITFRLLHHRFDCLVLEPHRKIFLKLTEMLFFSRKLGRETNYAPEEAFARASKGRELVVVNCPSRFATDRRSASRRPGQLRFSPRGASVLRPAPPRLQD